MQWCWLSHVQINSQTETNYEQDSVCVSQRPLLAFPCPLFYHKLLSISIPDLIGVALYRKAHLKTSHYFLSCSLTTGRLWMRSKKPSFPRFLYEQYFFFQWYYSNGERSAGLEACFVFSQDTILLLFPLFLSQNTPFEMFTLWCIHLTPW